MQDFLRNIADCDWFLIHIAFFFKQLAREIKVVIERSPNQVVAGVTIDNLRNILSKYPGSTRQHSCKFWSDPWGREMTYTPPNITNEQLIEFAETLLEHLGLKDIKARDLWNVPERFRDYIATALVIIGLLKKIPLVATPTEIKLQLKEPKKDIVPAVLTGIFYLRPGPDEPPFIKVGDTINKGEPICILEACKTFNRILADFRMRIIEIVAKDGKLVNAGDVLFGVEIL